MFSTSPTSTSVSDMRSMIERARSRAFVLVPAREQQRELVAPQAEGLATLTQAGRHLRQDLVTGRMPVPVVDLLEVVDVEQDEVSAKPSSCALSRSCWSRSWKCGGCRAR